MKVMCAGLVLFWAMAAGAQEECLKNGDFSKGKMNWQTAPGCGVVDAMQPSGKPGKVMEIELHKNHNLLVTQMLHLSTKTKALAISMKVKPGPNFKSAVPDANQMTLRFQIPLSATYSGRKIEPGADWQAITWDFSELSGQQKLNFQMEFMPGAGTVLLDDVSIKELIPKEEKKSK